MKSLTKTTLVIALAVLSFSTAFAQYNANFDKSTDFANYKTFYFAGWQKDSDSLVNGIDKQRILDAFKQQFEARGLTFVTESDNPDAIVTLYLVVDNKTSTTAYTNYNGGLGLGGLGVGMGYAGAAWGYGMGSSTTTYSEDDYQEGTMVMDVYDASTKKLIYQGSGQSVVEAKTSKRSTTIPKKVAKIMAKYPVAPLKN